MSDQRQHLSAERTLGTVGIVRRQAGVVESRLANIAWWDADADDYRAEHVDFLGVTDFVWCPERLREEDARLLGDVSGLDVLELGCGMAACARWLTVQGARTTALDVSSGMLRHAANDNAETGIHFPLVRASGDALPFKAESFDIVFSAFGGVPFVADVGLLMREVARTLRPGGRWVFAVTHPMRWCFPDDPGPDGLTVIQSYFDRSPYVEVDEHGRATYVEHHRTIGDFVRAITAAGMVLKDVVEPEWPEGHTTVWGQWSPLRGALFPGTAIFSCEKL